MNLPFIDLPDFRMYFEIHGSGPRTIVAVHGNLASTRWWKYLLPLIPPEYQVVMMDLRGCGRSSRTSGGYQIARFAEDIHMLMQALNVKRFHMLGHSMGGQIALYYAIHYPQWVQTLTLLDSVSAMGLSLTKEDRAFFTKLQQDKVFLRQAIVSCLPYFHDEEFINLLCDDAYACAADIYYQNPETMHETVLIDQVGKLTLPILVLHGREDVIIPIVSMQETINAMKKARVIFLENCGHSPFIEVPETAISTYFQFIGEHRYE